VRSLVLVALIVGAAAFLRLWRIEWALTDGAWFPDEVLWAHSAALFSPLSWHAFVDGRHLRLPYPTGYAILSGLGLATANGLGLSAFGSPEPDAILIARLVSAAAGVGTVVLLGLLARRMAGAAVGLAAAALMAVVPLHAMQNHYASADVLHTACVVLVMWAAWAVATRGTRGSAFALGAATGFAFATKYTGLAMAGTAVLVIGDRVVRQRSVERAVDLGVWLAAGFVIAVSLGCPPCIMAPDRVLGIWRWQWTFKDSDFVINHLVPSLGWYGRPYAYQLVAAFPYILGWPAYLLVLLGLAAAVRRRDAGDRVVLATIVPYFLAMGASRVTLLRYLLPIVPGLVVLAARSGALFERRRRLWSGAVIAACGYGFALTATQIARYSLTPQLEVARWAASVMPAGTSPRIVAPATLQSYVLLARPLAVQGLACAQAEDGRWFEDAPDVFVLPELQAVAIRRDDPDGVAAAELRRLESGELPYRAARRWRSWYLQRGVYTWLDPGFAISEGAMDFTVYVRDPQAPRPVTATSR
jgi:4-amino-4-deoxy-L-arabinose transferase-like glycosyltransferase